jgi:transposase
MNKSKEKSRRIERFSVVNPNSAGIDVADNEMVVAVSPDVCHNNVQTFGSFTRDLHHIAGWLKECGVVTVAMESTGVYWVQLFLLLQDFGFTVFLVNAKHVKNVTGRKDDECDAAWIQKLHSCGLLTNSFQPSTDIRALRSLVRHRKGLIRDGSKYLNRMQKAMELMNLKFHTVISDIGGKSGQNIIRAIVSGEREPEKLILLVDSRVKASQEEIIKSLEGYWRKEHLFELTQSYQMYLTIGERIKECDQEIEEQFSRSFLACTIDTKQADIGKKRKSTGKNKINFNVTSYLKTLIGTDLTEVVGISENTALEIIAETGTDMTKWFSEKHFTSWLGLAPNTKKSGGKVISSRILKKKHYAGQAFRVAANTLSKSKTPLGDYYRRIRAKAGPGKATVATARKLAVIFYNMVKNKTSYNPEALIISQQKYKEYKIRYLENQLRKIRAA